MGYLVNATNDRLVDETGTDALIDTGIPKSLLDSFVSSDALSVVGGSILDTLLEGVNLSDSVSALGTFLSSLSEIGVFSDTVPLPVISTFLSDGTSLSESLSALALFPNTLTDSTELADTQVISLIMYFTLLDALAATDNPAASQVYDVSLTDGISLSSIVRVIIKVLLTEGIVTSDTVTRVYTLVGLLVDKLNSSDLPTTSVTFTNLLADIFTVLDRTVQLKSNAITDSAVLSDQLSALATWASTLSETLDLSDAPVYTGIISFLLSDGITGTDSISNTITMTEALSEAIAMAIGVKDRGNTYQGWCLNPRNLAIWNYTNWNFNSIAKVGNDYFGAGSSGLYRLIGNLDNTSYIDVAVTTAALDLGTSNLKNIPQAYLGLTSEGLVLFKASTDNEKKIGYRLRSPESNLMVDKVKMSKAMKGAYWQFDIEATSTEEFNLDYIELWPIVWSRKQ